MAGAAEPFALGEGEDACLLLHGLTGSPWEVRPVGEALAAAGIRAVGPLLPGHGTSPRDLLRVSRSDVLDAASDALDALRGARRIYLCGLSMGALLAVRLAARGGPRSPVPAALALLAPATRMAGLNWAFTNVIGRLPALPLLLGKGTRDVQRSPEGPAPEEARPAAAGDQRRAQTAEARAASEAGVGAPRTGQAQGAQAPAAEPPGATDTPGALQRPDGSYTQVPWRWGRELRILGEEALADAHRVRARTLILHGALDRTAAPSGARILARALGGPTHVRTLPRSGHLLPVDVEGHEACAAIVRFFQEEE